ncbi:MAG TPA: hypothetical protein VFS00_05185 [Polyangiaceae bacterium]|nr:hypothetical protein [Polyangiaceae bacterium]
MQRPDTPLDPASVEAEARRIESLSAEERVREGFVPSEPLGVDPERLLVILKNGESCMLALDYRVDPPAVVSTERHISRRFVWRRLAADFDQLMTGD